MTETVEERAVELGEYIIENKATVRLAAKIFGISKSTVHKDVTQTLYRYRTKTTTNNTYTKWSYSENDSSLKGCTIIKSELVTTK